MRLQKKYEYEFFVGLYINSKGAFLRKNICSCTNIFACFNREWEPYGCGRDGNEEP